LSEISQERIRVKSRKTPKLEKEKYLTSLNDPRLEPGSPVESVSIDVFSTVICITPKTKQQKETANPYSGEEKAEM
jgi:hypothetical protein